MTDKEKVKILIKALMYYADERKWDMETIYGEDRCGRSYSDGYEQMFDDGEHDDDNNSYGYDVADKALEGIGFDESKLPSEPYEDEIDKYIESILS